ncbi:uncharacterized protein CPUR_08691 [Claviceps purpurea 20.1]|uniref:Uncharacterized protein n=1 Tax=Claviceps purpurea (strain 20.1) TaxID=1111077 RepID=M1WDE5_CLAP2|nr:uncharacterized protein CPUR_08691 [Claviceps purpurea 20.1]
MGKAQAITPRTNPFQHGLNGTTTKVQSEDEVNCEESDIPTDPTKRYDTMSGTTHPNLPTAQNRSETSVEDELDNFVDADPFGRMYLNTKLNDQKDFGNCHTWEGNIKHNEGDGRQYRKY